MHIDCEIVWGLSTVLRVGQVDQNEESRPADEEVCLRVRRKSVIYVVLVVRCVGEKCHIDKWLQIFAHRHVCKRWCKVTLSDRRGRHVLADACADVESRKAPLGDGWRDWLDDLHVDGVRPFVGGTRLPSWVRCAALKADCQLQVFHACVLIGGVKIAVKN